MASNPSSAFPSARGAGSGSEFDWSGFDDGLEISDDEFAKAILAGRRAEALSSADPFGMHRK